MTNEVIETLPGKDDCNFAMLAHLLGTVTGFLGALVIWLLKKDSSSFVAQQAAEALNFQITVLLAYLVCSMLTFILIGWLLFPLLFVLNIVFCILGALAASKGTAYRYPLALRLVN